MFKLLVAMDFDARLERALASARHGNVGASSPFGELLAEIGLAPSTYTMTGWKKHLSNFSGPAKGSDFERFALPVLVTAIGEFLDGDDKSVSEVTSRMNAAIEKARNFRKAARDDRSIEQQSTSAKPRISAKLAAGVLDARIDDALSLLEGAAASNHLSSAQRTRLIEVANRIAKFKPFSTATKHEPTAGSRPAGNSLPSRNRESGVIDGSRKMEASIRDHGQFGSLPSFDDLDEESCP